MSVTIEQTCLPETLAGGETLGKVLKICLGSWMIPEDSSVHTLTVSEEST